MHATRARQGYNRNHTGTPHDPTGTMQVSEKSHTGALQEPNRNLTRRLLEPCNNYNGTLKEQCGNLHENHKDPTAPLCGPVRIHVRTVWAAHMNTACTLHEAHVNFTRIGQEPCRNPA